jgi:lipoate synthase
VLTETVSNFRLLSETLRSYVIACRPCRRRSSPLRRDDFKDQTKVRISPLSQLLSTDLTLRAPHILVEALTGDFAGNLEHVSLVAKSGLDVYAHNIETVEALTPFVRDRRATFRQSLSVLKRAKEEGVKVTKTSIMLGVGETEDQVLDALKGIYHQLGIIGALADDCYCRATQG